MFDDTVVNVFDTARSPWLNHRLELQHMNPGNCGADVNISTKVTYTTLMILFVNVIGFGVI